MLPNSFGSPMSKLLPSWMFWFGRNVWWVPGNESRPRVRETPLPENLGANCSASNLPISPIGYCPKPPMKFVWFTMKEDSFLPCLSSPNFIESCSLFASLGFTSMFIEGTLFGECIISWFLAFFGLPCVIPSSSDDPMKLNPDWFLTFPPSCDVDGLETETIAVFWLFETSCLELKLLASVSLEGPLSGGAAIFVEESSLLLLDLSSDPFCSWSFISSKYISSTIGFQSRTRAFINQFETCHPPRTIKVKNQSSNGRVK